MRRRCDEESGAALLEAVLALALVGATTAGALVLHRSTVAARATAEGTVADLVVATTTAERLTAGLGDPGAVTDVTTGRLWTRRACDDPVPPTVHAVPIAGDAEPVDRAVGTLHVAAPGDGPDAVPVSIAATNGAPVPDAVVTATASDGTVITVRTDVDGCAELAPAPVPRSVRAVGPDGAEGSGLLAPGAAAIAVDLVRLGRVTVVLAGSGAAPDASLGDGLAWWAPSAPDGGTAVPGKSLELPAGPRTVVVGACADPRGGGSAALVDVVTDRATVVAVTLGGAAVARPQVDDGRRLVLRRHRPCPGPGGRPVLAWDVGGGGGTLVAAVPDGVWEADLLDAGGRRLAGPVALEVTGTTVRDLGW